MSVILRCYCCGQPIGKMIALVSMNAETDRVFVMIPEHAKRADHVQWVIVTVYS